MFAEERREMILAQLKSKGRILAKDLAKEFGTSIDTIRRDLTAMEERGLLKRTHGGAIPLSKVRRFPIDEKLRYGEGTEHQNAVAKLAVRYIEQGDTIFIGGASIHYVLLKYLPLDKDYTVITNSLIIAEKLKLLNNVETYIVCGKIKDEEGIIDALATEFIRTLRIDVAFLTGGGFSARHGLSSSTPEGSAFQRAVAEVSRKKICLANFDKIGTEFFSRTLEAKELDLLITDWEAPDKEIEKIKKLGIKVIIAK
ncbi:DeoR/GlpR family DNA-binding transcription regulator [Clostridium thermopalmarium]|uniref:HTH-type transcriptional repressor GlcR n=1 Tax=Clostridium thermopalmarium DSM 5974 TaxID=1121340 RepID=A0A2T0ANP3_9CLOT|nr:DeoR/GlpR family DNA-binding transcription regulator [Clostridium thermopalmarium]PRR70586.1 HTH-type transcriptional repressor GlcR [Clostridium thermopalmarium DSM 5974]PVZ21684.1 DeoR family transcriptional regulator [Clostridium thermopalmarium DSM 5974]